MGVAKDDPPSAEPRAEHPLQGASRLAIEATKSVMGIVEDMQRTIGSGPSILGQPLAGPSRVFTKLLFDHMRGVTQLVGTSIDSVLGLFAPLLATYAPEPGPARDAVLAALNGVIGDYLSETKNPLVIEMRLRHEGRPLALEQEALRAAFPQATGKLLVLVHGSCLSDRQWGPPRQDFGVWRASSALRRSTCTTTPVCTSRAMAARSPRCSSGW
jgi:hypothetical protein